MPTKKNRQAIGFLVWQGESEASVIYTEMERKEEIEQASSDEHDWVYYDLKTGTITTGTITTPDFPVYSVTVGRMSEDDAAVVEYRDEDTGTVFRWHGGAYVDVGYTHHPDPSGVAEGEFRAEDVINVWADAEDISHLEQEAEQAAHRRPFRHILELFEARCRKYLDEQLQEQDARNVL